MKSIRERLLAAFDLEHKDHLTAIRMALAAFEEQGAGLDIDEMHRRAHSLKGAARAVDLPAVERLAHHLESVLHAARKAGYFIPTPPAVALIRRALDTIEDITAEGMAPGVSGAMAGDAPVVSALAEALEHLARGEMALPPPPGTAPAPSPAATTPRTEVTSPLVRIQMEGLERMFATAAALFGDIEGQERLGRDLQDLRRLAGVAGEAWRQVRRLLAVSGRGHRLASAMQTMDGSLRALAILLESARHTHRRDRWALYQRGKVLRDNVRLLRMAPAETQFGGLGPVVRDLARVEGKEVRVELRGLDVTADRAVLQDLKDPVLHLARNAIHHGIETPDERRATGKAPVGRIVVTTTVAGGRLSVSVEDDGRGIDPATVRAAAVARGLLEPAAAVTASVADLHALLTEPGFSTAPSVTEVAGRGMGLSIVRRAVDSLQGTLTVRSPPGGGTAMTLTVPISLSSQRVVLVTAAGQTFAIRGADMARLHRATAGSLTRLAGRMVVALPGADLPAVSLAALLGLPCEGPGVAAPLWVVEAPGPDGSRAILVDGAVGTADTVVEAAAAAGLDALRYFGTILTEGSVPVLVLNLPALLDALPPGVGERSGAVPGAEHPAAATILVVDDSITTRTLERSILETHGYTVILANDGREALSRLGETTVDLIVSDIEMPVMDGFALLRAVRQTPTLAGIPVILVTSRDRTEDRERGLHLGADAYIVKTRFDQDDLLEGIRRLL
jgi:two-component system chemotaxis sensor kinase CheA